MPPTLEEQLEQAKQSNTLVTEVCATCPHHFVVMHGHEGGQHHNLGGALKNSAETHKKEIENGTWPNKPNWKIPVFRKGIDKAFVFYVPYVQEIEKSLSSIVPDGRVVYLAIYSHMGRGWTTYHDPNPPPPNTPADPRARLGLLFLNPDQSEGANLSDDQYYRASRPLTDIHKYHFLKIPDAQVRLFGCFGATAIPASEAPVYSIAGQFKNYLGLDTYGFADDNGTGSQGTNDRSLGHGDRAYRGPSGPLVGNPPTYRNPGDLIPPKNGDTWFVNVSPHHKPSFTKF